MRKLFAALLLLASAPNLALAQETLTQDEQTRLMAEFAAQWSIPLEAQAAMGQPVELRLQLNADTSVLAIKVVDEARYAADAGFKALADSAIAAVQKAAVDGLDLPPEKYAIWQDMIVTFVTTSYPK